DSFTEFRNRRGKGLQNRRMVLRACRKQSFGQRECERYRTRKSVSCPCRERRGSPDETWSSQVEAAAYRRRFPFDCRNSVEHRSEQRDHAIPRLMQKYPTDVPVRLSPNPSFAWRRRNQERRALSMSTINQTELLALEQPKGETAAHWIGGQWLDS